jgi:diguanylate cyclase (GGDEF)-like protein/PAS domain S-box-containing protein
MVDPGQPESGFVWIIADSTARKHAEEALRLSHRELETRVEQRTAELQSQLRFMQQLIEAIPGPVFYKDTDGRYLGANSAFAAFAGVDLETLVGKTAYDIAPPDLARRYSDSDRELLAAPGARVYESQVSHADGTRHDVVFHKATFTRPDGKATGIVGVMLDITERKRMEGRIHLAATVFDSTADGVTIADRDGNIITVNRAFTEITGYSEDEVRGKNPRVLQSGLQEETFYQRMWTTIQSDDRWSGEIWNRRKDGSIYPEKLTVSAIRDDRNEITNYVGVFSDITKLKSVQEALDFQAHHDPLTGLPNRLLLEDRLESALQRARREGHSLAVLFIDLDRFKNINDTLGHHVGDIVLCETASRFSAAVRESDTVARLGGDEFIIVIEHVVDPAAASRVADKILEGLRRPIMISGQEFFIGASLGISLFPQDGSDPADLLKHADAAMYRAKERGRNTFEFFSSDITSHSLERFKLEADIRYALEREELMVYFQPQFSLADGRLVGAEALVRWRHPERGMVSPGQFIPIAEESGIIVPMGEWILRQACREWVRWHSAGLRPGVLAVNVSGIEFRRGRVRESVELSLAETRLPPELLELEITESSIMNQTDSSIRALHSLREMGLHLAIDDFGTGYSSLSYLKRLPVSKLKVDQSFVKGLPDDAEDAAITRAIIALAHSLGLTTMAEGVETEAQRQFLQAAGCDDMQGYLLGKPMPAEQFLALLQRDPPAF